MFLQVLCLKTLCREVFRMCCSAACMLVCLVFLCMPFTRDPPKHAPRISGHCKELLLNAKNR